MMKHKLFKKLNLKLQRNKKQLMINKQILKSQVLRKLNK